MAGSGLNLTFIVEYETMTKKMQLGLVAVLFSGAGMLAVLPGLSTPALAVNQAGDQAHADHETLEAAMETINTNYRSVRRSSRDAEKNGETADLLAEMITAAIEAKTALPGVIHTADDEAKAELTAIYRKTMNDLIIILAQAENAALDGDNEKLGELVLAANEIKAVGHELFIPDDE
jgi:hypothetical protein